MADERWSEVDRLFQEALERDPRDRAQFLDQASIGDLSLRKEVEDLIRSHEEAGSFLRILPEQSLIGRNLGPYHVKSRLGSGGMGEVYLAEDSRLGRKVAIKTLVPAHFSDDQFRGRFLREARSVSSLSHPHICALYDIGQQDGIDYLVMEYLEGESLSARLKRGRLPLDQALRYATEIAAALDKAHRQGITHRDLKPANIMLTKSGAKLLDFGLAKMEPQGKELAEAKSLTESGVILGTLQYMSPEQLEGKETDARTDIFAFGAVLYEMVTGRKAFQATSQASLMAAILEHEPSPISPLEPTTPGALDHLIRGCLAKAPDDRWQTAHDLTKQLQWIAGTVAAPRPDSSALEGGAGPQHAAPFWRWVIPGFAACVAIGFAIGWLVIRKPAAVLVPRSDNVAQPTSQSIQTAVRSTASPRPAQSELRSAPDDQPGIPKQPAPAVTRFDVSVEPAGQLTGFPRPSRLSFAWSADGQVLAFNGLKAGVASAAKLYARRLSEPVAKPIEGTDLAIEPFFSPDGKWIAFWAPRSITGQPFPGQIKKVPVEGGPAVAICDVPSPLGTLGLFGASWAEDGTIFFSMNGIIQKVASGGGTPVPVTMNDVAKGEQHILPQPAPGGKSVIFTTVSTGDWDKAQIVIQSLESHERRVLIQGGTDARYIRTGHLLYMKAGTLMAVPFDAQKLQVRGDPVALIENVMHTVNTPNINDQTGAGQWAVSSSGTLAYATGGIEPSETQSPVWVDRKGEVQGSPFSTPQPFSTPRISPGGDQAAFGIRVPGSINMQSRDLWVHDLARGAPLKLTSNGLSLWEVWSPDGKRLVFSSEVSGLANLHVMNADGSGRIERLATSPYAQAPTAWVGNQVAFVEFHQPNWQIWTLSVDGDRKPKLFLEGPFSLTSPEFSPDGTWIAYESTESGPLQQAVYVQPFPGPGEKHRISPGNGSEPIWSADGSELFYREGPKFYSVSIAGTNPFRAEVPRLLFESKPGQYAQNSPVRNWDVSRDGQRFLLMRNEPSKVEPVTQIHVVLNWTEELKHLAPASR